MTTFSDERIQKILAGRRAIGRVPFPGPLDEDESITDVPMVGLRLLSEADTDAARIATQSYLHQKLDRKNLDVVKFIDADPDAMQREYQRQVLVRACVDPDCTDHDNPTPFFAVIEQVRKLDVLTLDRLWDAYGAWQEEVNPRFSLTEQQVRELDGALKKALVDQATFALLERDTLLSLLRIMAARSPSSPSGRSTTSGSS